MVKKMIAKLNGSNGKKEMYQAIGILIVFIGLLLMSLTWANSANSKSKEALTKVDNIDKRLDRMENKIDKLMEKK